MINLLSEIESSFGWRTIPTELVSETTVARTDPKEYEICFQFAGKDWREVSRQMVDSAESPFWYFVPKAFCYYLPGLMTATLQQNDGVLLSCYEIMVILQGFLAKYAHTTRYDPRLDELTLAELETLEKFFIWCGDFHDEQHRQEVFKALQDLKDRKLSLLSEIESSFGWRTIPTELVTETTIARTDPKDYEVCYQFAGKDWHEIQRPLLEAGSPFLYFAPEAFGYYLPAVLSIAIRDSDPGWIAVIGITAALDKFALRWKEKNETDPQLDVLTFQELVALQEFFDWAHPRAFVDPNALQMTYRAIGILKGHRLNLLSEIESSFGWRTIPTELVAENTMAGNDPEDYEVCFQFAGKDWREVSRQMVDSAGSAFFYFVPKAFCYYLPGLIKASIEDNPHGVFSPGEIEVILQGFLANHAQGLSSDPRLDELTLAEVETLEKFIIWCGAFGFTRNRREVFSALQVLKERKRAESS